MRRTSEYVVLWVRVFFGAHLLYSSLRYFLVFEPQPVVPGLGGQFVAALSAMGLFTFVKALEGVVGALLLCDLFVPLVLVVEVPISLNIFYLNFVVVGTPRQLFTGPQEIALNLFLLLAYGAYYRPAMAARARPRWLGGAAINESP